MRLHLTLTVEHPDGSEDRHHWVNVPGAVAEVLREVCGEPAGKTYAPVPVSDTEPRRHADGCLVGADCEHVEPPADVTVGDPPLPEQESGLHNALADARHLKVMADALAAEPTQKGAPE